MSAAQVWARLGTAVAGLLPALLALGALPAGCTGTAEGPPHWTLERTACAECSMLLSDGAFVAAYRLDGEERLFDDVGCLLAALEEEPAAERAEVWVSDYESHRWMAADAATFVHVPDHLSTPMGSGLAAFHEPAAAAALAQRKGGRVVAGWERLLRERRDGV